MRIRGTTSRWPRGAALAGFAALAIAACGGSSGNGIASKPASAIVVAAGKALGSVHSVHISGTTSSGSGAATIGVNLSIVAGKGARGTLTLGGLDVKVVSIHGKLYMNGNAAFWKKFGNAAAASVFGGKWVETTSGATSFAPLLNLHTLLGKVLQQAKNAKALQKGRTTIVNGKGAIAVNAPNQGGSLYERAGLPARARQEGFGRRSHRL